MSAFTLDTSGFVENLDRATQDHDGTRWSDLTPFEQGYVEALLRSLVIDDADIIEASERTGVSLLPGFSDLDPTTLEVIRKDCAAMLSSLQIDNSPGQGAEAWRLRQTGWRNWGTTPPKLWLPLTASLSDTGKVVFS